MQHLPCTNKPCFKSLASTNSLNVHNMGLELLLSLAEEGTGMLWASAVTARTEGSPEHSDDSTLKGTPFLPRIANDKPSS